METRTLRRTVLAALHEARGARWMEYYGWEIPARYGALKEEYEALQEGVGLVDLSHRQKLRIKGRDRRSWLHGQVTQDVNGLPDGRGAYATVLNAQGRLVCDARIFALPDAVSAMRAVRKQEPRGDLVSLSAADPLNLAGIITPGARVPALTNNRVLYRDGAPVATLTGGQYVGTDGMNRPLLYTPNPRVAGSSVSHWDTIATPNLLMEPNISADLGIILGPPKDLTLPLLKDLGW